MTYTDQLIDRYDQTVDDEYERLVLRRASSVSVRAIYLVTLILMAVLAWVLPGLHSLWAFTLLLPLAVGGLALSDGCPLEPPGREPWSPRRVRSSSSP